jgi:hypothetical protein
MYCAQAGSEKSELPELQQVSLHVVFVSLKAFRKYAEES